MAFIPFKQCSSRDALITWQYMANGFKSSLEELNSYASWTTVIGSNDFMTIYFFAAILKEQRRCLKNRRAS